MPLVWKTLPHIKKKNWKQIIKQTEKKTTKPKFKLTTVIFEGLRYDVLNDQTNTSMQKRNWGNNVIIHKNFTLVMFNSWIENGKLILIKLRDFTWNRKNFGTAPVVYSLTNHWASTTSSVRCFSVFFSEFCFLEYIYIYIYIYVCIYIYIYIYVCIHIYARSAQMFCNHLSTFVCSNCSFLFPFCCSFES